MFLQGSNKCLGWGGAGCHVDVHAKRTSAGDYSCHCATRCPSQCPGSKVVGPGQADGMGVPNLQRCSLGAPGFKADDFGKHAFALDLEYLREFRGDEIADRSLSEIRRLTPLSEAQEQQWTRQMRAIFPPVRSGDRLTGVHVPGVGAKFLFNGKNKGEIRDAEFANLFFGIWLSGGSSEPKMRRELLAGLAAN